MIEMGATDFNRGLYIACENGVFAIVELMIEHGATDFNSGLSVVCKHKNLKLAKLMVEKGANDFNRALRGMRGEVMDRRSNMIIRFLLKNGATDDD